MNEDSFEKARKAFFVSQEKSPKPNGSGTELKPRNESPRENPPARHKSTHEAT